MSLAEILKGLIYRDKRDVEEEKFKNRDRNKRKSSLKKFVAKTERRYVVKLSLYCSCFIIKHTLSYYFIFHNCKPVCKPNRRKCRRICGEQNFHADKKEKKERKENLAEIFKAIPFSIWKLHSGKKHNLQYTYSIGA